MPSVTTSSLVQSRLPGHARLAWLNVALSTAAGLAAVVLGHWLGAAL